MRGVGVEHDERTLELVLGAKFSRGGSHAAGSMQFFRIPPGMGAQAAISHRNLASKVEPGEVHPKFIIHLRV
jgi:hypothetical protein